MKRKYIEEFIDKHLEYVNDLKSLTIVESLTNKNINLLLSIPSKERNKDRLKCLFFLQKRINMYKELFIASALEEQVLFLSKDRIDNYRYRARFDLGNIKVLPLIKGYKLLQKYGYYNKVSNPLGVVKDHRFSIAEGVKRNIDPAILGHLCNCEFLLYNDNLKKGKKCSITYSELLKEISNFNKNLPL